MKIKSAVIVKGRFENTMQVVMEDGTEKNAFTYYPDELSFSPSEVIGMSLYQAVQLKYQKDVAYLRS
jgi:hypothetical protein